MKIKNIIIASMLLFGMAATAQSDEHKAPVNTAPLPSTPVADHAHSAGTATQHSTAVQTPAADHAHDAVPSTHTTATPTSSKPATPAAHPVSAPSGAEAKHYNAPAPHAKHEGPTPVRSPAGAEAARHKDPKPAARHEGPTPVRTGTDHPDKK